MSLKKITKFPSKPLKSLTETVTGIGKVAGGVAALGISGGTLGGIAGSVLGFLGGDSTLGKAINGICSLSGAGQSALLGGGAAGNALAAMLVGTDASDAQKAFIKQALNGGMTANQIAANKKFQELNYNRSQGAQQTAADGIKAFTEAQAEMKTTADTVGNLTADYSGANAQKTANDQIATQQQTVATGMANHNTNTANQQEATKQLTANGQSIQQGLSGVNSAIAGLASSYGMKGVGTPGTNPVAGTSVGQPIVAGFNQTLGVAQGDLVKQQQQTLDRQILEAQASGASPAQLAEMKRRGEMSIQEQASRLAVSNEREGAQALLQAQQAAIPFIQAGTTNAQALSQTDLAMQQMDQIWQESAAKVMESMRQQGLTEEDIQRQIADAKANYEIQKQQLKASIQQGIASGNLGASQLSLSDVQSAMSAIGSNLNSQNATGAQAMNSATNMITDAMKAQAEAYANAGANMAAQGSGKTTSTAQANKTVDLGSGIQAAINALGGTGTNGKPTTTEPSIVPTFGIPDAGIPAPSVPTLDFTNMLRKDTVAQAGK